MKKVIVGLVVAIMLITTVSAACTDSDGGRNYNVKGTTLLNGISLVDTCKDANYVREYFCSSSTRAAYTYSYCQYGCSNGKCNPKSYCGDGIVQAGEQCDNGITNGQVCIAPYATYYTMNDIGNTCNYCSSKCIDVQLPARYCGDGILDLDFETFDYIRCTSGNACYLTCN